MIDPAELYERARRVGIPEADLPRQSPHPQRRLPLEGGLNFRDMGGYPTTEGGTTRWGVLYRSDHLNTLTDGDVAHLDSLGLQRVHDFRLQKERDRQPSRLPDGVEVRHLAAGDLGLDETMVDVVQDVLAGRRPLPPPTFWDDNYEDMVERARPMFSALINSITDDDGSGLPSLFKSARARAVGYKSPESANAARGPKVPSPLPGRTITDPGPPGLDGTSD